MGWFILKDLAEIIFIYLGFEITKLEANKNYTVWIMAENEAGVSDKSEAIVIQTKKPGI